MGVALYAPRDDNPALTVHIALVNCISTYDKSNYPHVQQMRQIRYIIVGDCQRVLCNINETNPIHYSWGLRTCPL